METRMTPSDDHPLMVIDCEKRESRMNDWEIGFIKSIQEQIGSGRALTSKQSEILDEIWEKVTADG